MQSESYVPMLHECGADAILETAPFRDPSPRIRRGGPARLAAWTKHYSLGRLPGMEVRSTVAQSSIGLVFDSRKHCIP